MLHSLTWILRQLDIIHVRIDENVFTKSLMPKIHYFFDLWQIIKKRHDTFFALGIDVFYLFFI